MKKEDLINNELYVECDQCGHIVNKGRAQTVKVESVVFGGTHDRIFCELHKKPYSKKEIWSSGPKYFGMVEMSAGGTPIGYKKIPARKSTS